MKSVGGAGLVRLYRHAKPSTLNSAHNLELVTGGWESGPALQVLLPIGPDFPDLFIQNVKTFIPKLKKVYDNNPHALAFVNTP